MKKLLVVFAIPLMLFGLERVNLVKNHGFEKEDSSWLTYTGTWKPAPENDSAQANSHDPTRYYEGLFSASANTSSQPGDPTPPALIIDSATVIQGFSSGKLMKDLDSLTLEMKLIPKGLDFSRLQVSFISLVINAGETNSVWGYYWFHKSTISSKKISSLLELSFDIPFTNDTSWLTFSRSIREDWINTKGVSPEAQLDSIGLVGFGKYDGIWYGQKIYWDDIRLTGYADYDVGVKSILSGDSTGSGYTPTARIKNFGRKAADTFLVIAEIKKAETIVYADTMPYALPADTEDTVSFKEFTPPDASNYTLTVSTLMTPDESDEDDAMSKTLYGSGIVEPVTPTSPSAIQLEITALSSIRYTLPSGERGTLTVYDPSGRRIESYRIQGEGQVAMKSNLSSGVYFIKLEAGKASVTKKAVVLQ